MEKIFKLLRREVNKNSDKQLVIWCIGSSNIIGDSLGPYVGEILIKNCINNNVVIKGNLSNPVHYLNIQKEIIDLSKRYSDMYSIVVDSSLYNKSYIGKIVVVKNKTILGSALNKKMYKIGDVSIKGIVGEDYKNPLKNIKILEKIPQKLIEEMSVEIAKQVLELIS